MQKTFCDKPGCEKEARHSFEIPGITSRTENGGILFRTPIEIVDFDLCEDHQQDFFKWWGVVKTE